MSTSQSAPTLAFDIGMQHCPNCGAVELKIFAAILERPVIEKILTHGAGPTATAQEAQQALVDQLVDNIENFVGGKPTNLVEDAC